MPDAIEISPANPLDIPALCELLGILFAQEAEFQPDSAAQQHALSQIIANREIGCVFVARHREKTAGMVSLLYSVSTALGGRVATLEDMVVHPDFRNAGMGTRLLNHAKQFACQTGCKRITLLTDQTNLAAQRFYQRHGFSSSAMLPMRLLLEPGMPPTPANNGQSPTLP
jgi:GNAT superfamily N-acetyltransferase